MWAFFVLSLVAVAFCIGLLLRRYAAPSVPWVVRLSTAYAWLTAFSVIVFVPIDVWSTLADKPQTALTVFWQIAYWSTQVLTWLLLPFFQVYADAGDFTVGARCMTSLKENGLLYGLAGGAGAVGLCVIVFVQKSFQIADLAALGMAMSNTFGLAAGILLMGYGLVELPREMWKSDPAQLLKWCAHRAGRLAEEVIKATNELDTVVTIICANQKQMPRRDPLQPYMTIIADAAEAESPVKPSTIASRQLDIESLAADDLEYNYDKAGLAALRRRLTYAIHEYKGAHSQYAECITTALVLEDVMKCRQVGEFEPPPRVAPPAGSSALRVSLSRSLWRYRCTAHPSVRKVCAAALGGMSLAVIWAEATIISGRTPDLSPFSLLIRAAHTGEWSTQFLTILPLAYICTCTYFALFRINAFNYNKLLKGATTGAALMQNGSLMCRFAAPTCWNFLHMIHMTGTLEGGARTVFEENLGSMTVLPVLGKHLNVYLPLLLGVHCALIALKLWDRLAGACVSSKYRFSSDDVDDQYTERGRQLLRREAEAAANGLRIGDILHSDALDIELPGLAKRKARLGGKKKSWFNFGWPAAQAPRDALGTGVEEGGRGGSSTAAAERAPLFSGSRSDEPGRQGGGLLASLVKNKHSNSPPNSESDSGGGAASALGGSGGAGGGGGGGARSSGLDGIFAELSSGSAPAGGGRGGPRGGAAMRRSAQ